MSVTVVLNFQGDFAAQRFQRALGMIVPGRALMVNINQI